jgi:hypothetical protein
MRQARGKATNPLMARLIEGERPLRISYIGQIGADEFLLRGSEDGRVAGGKDDGR